MFYGEFAEEGIEGTIQKMRGKEKNKFVENFLIPPPSTLLLGLRNGEERWSNFPIPPFPLSKMGLPPPLSADGGGGGGKRREKWSSRKEERRHGISRGDYKK